MAIKIRIPGKIECSISDLVCLFQSSGYSVTRTIGIPIFAIKCLNIKAAVSTSLIFMVVRINIPYFVHLSTIIRILLNPLDKGNSGIKSIDTTSQGLEGMGMGCNNLAGV